MSLKNYIFASINTKSSSSYHNREEDLSRSTTTMATVDEEDETWSDFNCNWIKKVWSFISVEPVMICWLLPSCLLYIAIENLALEKSCRVNFGYDDIVCDNMIDKSINNIDCVVVRSRHENQTILDASMNASTIINGTDNMQININETLNQLEIDVCHAEVDSQILDSALNVYTAPFDSLFGIVMILFAGGWSDKKGKRKPCMLLPLLGELAALIVLLIAAIFMKQLPLEFNSIGAKLFPAITGGANLMLMGVYSYLTEMTDEQDRTFRFGIFAVFVPLIPIASVPFSGILFQKLRYIQLILLCIPINIIGILYIVFVLKEVKPKEKTEPPEIVAAPNGTNVDHQNGVDNPSFDMNETHSSQSRPSNGHLLFNGSVITEKIKKNFLVEFFNPIVAIDCLRVILKKRKHNGRNIVMLLLVMYFIATGPAFGEEPNEYNFTRIQLNWDGLKYSPFATYGNAVSLAGTMLMVGGLSKIFHLSDPLVGFLGTFFSSISRIVYAAATTATMLYIARTIDMFVSVRALTIKSVISTFVDNAELGRIFSIIGIIEAFGKFVFVSVYSIIYKNTLESLPSAFYIISFFCLVITAVMFIILYFIVRKKTIRDAAIKAEQENGNGNATIDVRTNIGETTHI